MIYCSQSLLDTIHVSSSDQQAGIDQYVRGNCRHPSLSICTVIGRRADFTVANRLNIVANRESFSIRLGKIVDRDALFMHHDHIDHND